MSRPGDRQTIGQALHAASQRLAAAGLAEPRDEALYLLAALLGTGLATVLARQHDPLAAPLARRLTGWIERRARREPAQHVTGVQEFYGLEFRVDGRALVPRPETEGLVDAVLGLGLAARASVADLGTGTGCIAIALALARPDWRVHALELSAAAAELARDNLRRHGLAERVRLVEGDWFAAPAAWRGGLDAVVSNPPYVAEDDWRGLEPEVREHDPREALVAGPTGLEAYRTLVPAAAALVRAGGWLVLELGAGQAEAVSRFVREAGWKEIEVRPDLRRIPRVLLARAV